MSNPMSDLFPVLRDKLAQRLAKRVAVRGPDDCWEWMGGSRHWFGYGRLNVTVPGTGRRMSLSSSRVAYALDRGNWPADEMVVRHRCDNPPCCNPRHLVQGSHADNVADRHSRGRTARNDGLGQTRLSEEDIASIREALAHGKRGIGRRLAEKYGVTPAHISGIRSGKTRRLHHGP